MVLAPNPLIYNILGHLLIHSTRYIHIFKNHNWSHCDGLDSTQYFLFFFFFNIPLLPSIHTLQTNHRPDILRFLWNFLASQHIIWSDRINALVHTIVHLLQLINAAGWMLSMSCCRSQFSNSILRWTFWRCVRS